MDERAGNASILEVTGCRLIGNLLCDRVHRRISKGRLHLCSGTLD